MNYIIPYSLRETIISDFPQTEQKAVCVDNVGIIVKYRPEDADKLNPENIRKHLIGFSDQHTMIIQADNLEEALKEFYEIPETKVGTKYKAMELADKETKPIIEYSSCEHMVVNNWIRCGYYDEPKEESSMVCILGGLDQPPEVCPILKQRNSSRVEVFTIGGIWIKRFYEHCIAHKPITNGVTLR